MRLVTFAGLSARAIGCVYLSAAAFMHLHWFWTASPRFWGYAQLGKIFAALGLIAGFGVFFYSVLAF